MPDEEEVVVTPGEDADDDTEDTEDEDTDDTEGADEESADGEASGGDTEGGSGSTEGTSTEAPKADVTVAPPAGKALLDLLAGDPEAQKLMASTLQDMIADNARTAETAAQTKEFTELVEKGDYAEVGRRIIERTQSQQARDAVADEVLKEVFQPVYADLFAQPELQNLSAEEKEALNPAKYDTDAHYVRRLSEVVQEKRFAKLVEDEVTKRIKARDDAAGNRKTADQAKRGTGTAPTAVPQVVGGTSGERISRGLRVALFGEGGSDDGDDD